MSQTMAAFLEAVDLISSGHYPQAQALLTGALATDPDNGDLYEALARLYDRSGQDEKGLAVCQAWVARYPSENMAHSNLSVFYQKLGRIEEALFAKA